VALRPPLARGVPLSLQVNLSNNCGRWSDSAHWKLALLGQHCQALFILFGTVLPYFEGLRAVDGEAHSSLWQQDLVNELSR